MKQKTPMQQLIDWLDTKDCHIDMYAILRVKEKATELLELEKQTIIDAANIGCYEESSTGIDGNKYFNETYEQ